MYISECIELYRYAQQQEKQEALKALNEKILLTGMIHAKPEKTFELLSDQYRLLTEGTKLENSDEVNVKGIEALRMLQR